MRSEEPRVYLSYRYSIKQTCALLGIHCNTLRYYTEKGFIKCGYRMPSKRKFYTGRDILYFWRAKY